MIVVRELVEHAELVTAVQLQKEIWGFSDLDLLPVRLFVSEASVERYEGNQRKIRFRFATTCGKPKEIHNLALRMTFFCAGCGAQ